MKTKTRIFKNTIKSVLCFSTNFKIIVSLFSIIIAFSSASCKSDDEINSNFVYGLSTPNAYTVTKPDSIVQIDLSNGKYKNLSSSDKFEGLNSAKHITYSKNQNVIVYDIERFEVGFINLDNLTSELIDFGSDSTFTGIKSLQIIEEKNLLLAFIGHFSYADNSRSLDIVEINLKTKSVISRSKFMDFDYTLNIFTAIDETNNRFFLIPDNNFSKPSDKLYIFNYEKKELTNQQINANFSDVHYSSVNQCLVGSSYTNDGIGLLSYSIINQKTDTIGSYSGISWILPKMNFFDKNTNLYWLGILTTQGPDYLKLTNINLSNASFSTSFSMPKFVNIIN